MNTIKNIIFMLIAVAVSIGLYYGYEEYSLLQNEQNKAKLDTISVEVDEPLKNKQSTIRDDMPKVIVKDVKLVQIDDDYIVEIALCNKSNETYFFSKRFIYGELSSQVIWGFEIKQNGKEIDYTGALAKIKEVFPKDYHSINPDECIVLSTPLNGFFNFDITKEIEINYFMDIVSSTNETVHYIDFAKTVKLQQSNENKIFEPIKR